MTYLKYIGIPFLLVIAHFFAGYWAMIAIWALTGLVFGAIPRITRFPLLAVAIAELLAFCCYFAFVVDVKGSLYPFAHFSGIAPATLLGTVASVNIITALLCSATGFYIVRLFKPVPAHNTIRNN
ncbi:hypothetical protein GO495_16785 [Chitinophaga oryziterrae]|uniref:Uncharacterized protein n=1 Tax=Chitinophaga oryziterrae TaxID=1031224 RepID=A0A6N8JDA1_9BACT|nr:hypothetical protein [Chitinophaga oryziterrae]MVT42249.1 hypothetical protein [Chitinophaga oryziterrae]